MLPLSRLFIGFLCCVMLAPAQRKWASEAEQELYQDAQSEKDPAQTLFLVERWRLAYPDSEFKDLRLRLKVAANEKLGRHEDVLEAAGELLNLDAGDVNALHSIVVNGPKVQSASAEQLELVLAAANALVMPPPKPKPEVVMLNGVPTKAPAPAHTAANRPPPVPPTTLEESSPEGQAVTSMIAEWRRSYRPTPDPAVQRQKDAESALEWVRSVRR